LDSILEDAAGSTYRIWATVDMRDAYLTPRLRRTMRTLVRANELRLRHDVSLHRLLHIGLRGALAQIPEHGVERIELEEVPMTSDRRARTTVAEFAEIVLPFARPCRESGRVHTFQQDPPTHSIYLQYSQLHH